MKMEFREVVSDLDKEDLPKSGAQQRGNLSKLKFRCKLVIIDLRENGVIVLNIHIDFAESAN